MSQDQQPNAQMNMNIDLKNTSPITTPEGGKIFQQGVILRKVSKFVSGTDEDAVMPIPVFFDPDTNKILKSTMPQELREEYKDDLIDA
jgi:hypothetical protein